MLLQVLLDVGLMRLFLLRCVHGKQEEVGSAACQGCDFGDLRKIHAEFLDDAGIEDKLAGLEAVASLAVVIVQQREGRLHFLAQLFVGIRELDSFAVEQLKLLLGHDNDDKAMDQKSCEMSTSFSCEAVTMCGLLSTAPQEQSVSIAKLLRCIWILKKPL